MKEEHKVEEEKEEGGGGVALARVRCPSLRRQPNRTLVTNLSLRRSKLVNLVPCGFGSSIRRVLLWHTLRQLLKVVPVRIPDQLRPTGHSHSCSLCGSNWQKFELSLFRRDDAARPGTAERKLGPPDDAAPRGPQGNQPMFLSSAEMVKYWWRSGGRCVAYICLLCFQRVWVFNFFFLKLPK